MKRKSSFFHNPLVVSPSSFLLVDVILNLYLEKYDHPKPLWRIILLLQKYWSILRLLTRFRDTIK